VYKRQILGTEVTSRVFETRTYGRKYGFNEDRLIFEPWPNGIPNPNGMYDSDGNPMSVGGVFGRRFRDGDLYADDRLSYKTRRYFSVYGNIAYTFNDKYTASFSYRTDASNLISSDPSTRYSPFWSIGGSWQLSKEKFISDIDFIDRLGLRVTYGFNGNANASSSVDPLISYWGYNSLTGTARGIISNTGNPTLAWEKTGTFDLGIDYTLFGGKLFGKLDIYTKDGKDLISTVSIPAVNGNDSQAINAVEMYNRGFELSVGTQLSILNKDVVWSGNLNLAYNKNKITKLYKDDGTLRYRLYGNGSGWEFVEGYNSQTVWGFKYGGMYNFGTEENPDMRPSILSVDGKTHKDFSAYTTGFNNGDYIVDHGTYNPPFTLGHTSNFKIYDFNLSCIITGYFGHIFMKPGFDYSIMRFGKANISKYYSDVKNGDSNKIIPIPENGSSIYGSYSSYASLMDYRAIKADNIRIDEINLTYNLPKRYLKKIGVDALSVFVQANNVGVINFNKYNIDPLYPAGNIKPGVSYTMGMKFNF